MNALVYFEQTEAALDALLESAALLHEALMEDLAALEEPGKHGVGDGRFRGAG